MEHKEGDGKHFTAAVLARFDLDIVRHAIFDKGYISRLKIGKVKKFEFLFSGVEDSTFWMAISPSSRWNHRMRKLSLFSRRGSSNMPAG